MTFPGPKHGTIYTKSMAVDDRFGPIVIDFVVFHLQEGYFTKTLDQGFAHHLTRVNSGFDFYFAFKSSDKAKVGITGVP